MNEVTGQNITGGSHRDPHYSGAGDEIQGRVSSGDPTRFTRCSVSDFRKKGGLSHFQASTHIPLPLCAGGEGPLED